MAREEKSSQIDGFLFLEKNIHGNDYGTADIHGNVELLQETMKGLKQGDRLFIAGDLVDKGADSCGVVRFILANNADHKKARIIVVRGNHEQECLDSIRYLEYELLKQEKNFDPLVYFKEAIAHDSTYYLEALEKYSEVHGDESNPPEDLNKLMGYYPYVAFLKNKHDLHLLPASGGKWLHTLFTKEIREGKIKIKEGKVKYGNNSDVGQIKNLFESLPYIIKIANTAVVVHADLLLSDENLNEIEAGRFHLEKFDLAYIQNKALWWRESDDGPNELRDPYSLMLFCGHSITLCCKGAAHVRDTNAINGDVCIFYNNVGLRLNFTLKQCEVIRGVKSYKKPHIENYPETLVGTAAEMEVFLNEMIEDINLQLKLQSCFEWSASKMQPKDVDAALVKLIASFNEKDRQENYLSVLRYMVNMPFFATEEFRSQMALFLLKQSSSSHHFLAKQKMLLEEKSSVDSISMMGALGILIGGAAVMQGADLVESSDEITIKVSEEVQYHLKSHVNEYLSQIPADSDAAKVLAIARINAPNGVTDIDIEPQRKKTILLSSFLAGSSTLGKKSVRLQAPLPTRPRSRGVTSALEERTSANMFAAIK